MQKRLLHLAALLFLVVPPADGVAGLRPSTVPAAVAAHELGQSYVFFRIYDDSLAVRVEITAADVERALGFGWVDGRVPSVEEVGAVLDSLRGYVEERLHLATAEGPLPLRFVGHDVRFLEVADYVQLEYAVGGIGPIPDEIRAGFEVLFDVDRDHRNFLVIEHNWKTGTFNAEEIALIFAPGDGVLTLDLSERSLWRGFMAFIRLGVWHIWIGIDHILFLMALVLPSVLTRRDGRWVPVESFRRALINIVTIVTMFTVAHSVTLSLAALDIVRLAPRFVESVIAASIAVAAAANLFPGLRVREAAIAFVFGLFHGFGFAYVLGDIGVGREHLVLSLFGFNVGVEIGQLVIICLVFPVLFLLRKSRLYPHLLRWGSLFLIAVAMLWVVERVFEFNVPIVGTLRSLLGMGA